MWPIKFCFFIYNFHVVFHWIYLYNMLHYSKSKIKILFSYLIYLKFIFYNLSLFLKLFLVLISCSSCNANPSCFFLCFHVSSCFSKYFFWHFCLFTTHFRLINFKFLHFFWCRHTLLQKIIVSCVAFSVVISFYH